MSIDKSGADPKLVELIDKLEAKYEVMGQDLTSYLDGLLYSNYLTYWKYIHLDTLLSLQSPQTDFPDENVFIIYHQITELYFKLILHEMRQTSDNEQVDEEFFISRLQRINRYFEALTYSFDVMIEGMDPDQFIKFRMALLPASGFQSGQYRLIEFRATDMHNLVDKEYREKFQKDDPIEEMYKYIYWKRGATELATGKKTLTLRQFEEKYRKKFLENAHEFKGKNLWQIYVNNFSESPDKCQIISELKRFDLNVNVKWPLVHYKSAVRYLQKDPVDIAATGGTNWQKYLPPRFRLRIFYPDLWTDEEKENWGVGVKV